MPSKEHKNLSSRTKVEYERIEKKLKSLFNQNINEIIKLEDDVIFEVFNKNELKEPTRRSFLSRISKLRSENNIDNTEIRKYLVKYVEKAKETPDKKDYKEDIESNEDFNKKIYEMDLCKDKIILILVASLKYDVLRTDYSTVKFKNYDEDKDNYYKEGVIKFNVVRKRNQENTNLKPISIKLDKNDKNIIEEYISTISNREYIFHLQLPSSFAKWIKVVGKKHLNVEYTISDYRKMCPRYILDKCETVSELVKTQRKIAYNQGHSSNTQLDYYLKDVKLSKVKQKVETIQYEETIELIVNGKKLIISGENIKITMG